MCIQCLRKQYRISCLDESPVHHRSHCCVTLIRHPLFRNAPKTQFNQFLFLKSGSRRKCLPGVTWEVLCPSSSLPQQSHHRLSRCLKKNTSERIYPRFTLSYFISTSAEGSNPPLYPHHYPASILFRAARYRKVNLCSNPSHLGKTAVGANARLFTFAANMCVFLDVSKVISHSCFFFFFFKVVGCLC